MKNRKKQFHMDQRVPLLAGNEEKKRDRITEKGETLLGSRLLLWLWVACLNLQQVQVC
jgi:hypothetical protein